MFKELDTKQKVWLSATYALLLFGIICYSYVQYVLYSSALLCKRQATTLYVWLICEVTFFYCTIFLFVMFSTYYTCKKRSSKEKFVEKKYVNVLTTGKKNSP